MRTNERLGQGRQCSYNRAFAIWLLVLCPEAHSLVALLDVGRLPSACVREDSSYKPLWSLLAAMPALGSLKPLLSPFLDLAKDVRKVDISISPASTILIVIVRLSGETKCSVVC